MKIPPKVESATAPVAPSLAVSPNLSTSPREPTAMTQTVPTAPMIAALLACAPVTLNTMVECVSKMVFRNRFFLSVGYHQTQPKRVTTAVVRIKLEG